MPHINVGSSRTSSAPSGNSKIARDLTEATVARAGMRPVSEEGS